MAIERNRWGFDGEITFSCDEKHCYEEYHADTSNFNAALEKMKAEGWKVKKDKDGEWCHTCPGCQEDDNDVNEDFDVEE